MVASSTQTLHFCSDAAAARVANTPTNDANAAVGRFAPAVRGILSAPGGP